MQRAEAVIAMAMVFVIGALTAAAQSGTSPAGSAESAIDKASDLVAAHSLAQANEVLSEFLQQDPGNVSVLLALGRIQLNQQLNDDAMKSFEAILSAHPDSAPAREGEVQAAAAAALADQKIGIDGDALLCLIRARKFVPDSPELLFDFGEQAERMHIYHDADDALTQAHALAPQEPKILYALAHVQLDEQKMPEAESNLRAYLKLRPDDATAHYGLGHLLHMVTRNDEARTELARSVELQPQQSASYYELGEIALENDSDDEARTNYQTVLSLAPHHGGALTGMGILAFRAKDYTSAEQYLRSAVLYAPEYATAHHYLSLVLARQGRTDESKVEADKAAALNDAEMKARRGNQLTIIH
jgi:tetratricopeptide (TPR) repeat protein